MAVDRLEERQVVRSLTQELWDFSELDEPRLDKIVLRVSEITNNGDIQLVPEHCSTGNEIPGPIPFMAP